MEYSNNSRYLDALLLLSLKIKEVDWESTITSTSFISSTVLNELNDMDYLDFANGSWNYIITEKGMQVLDQIKQSPWENDYVYMISQISCQETHSL